MTLSAAPWVSEEIVAEAYFNLQQRILPGKQNKALEQRRLELLRFVLQRENPLELTKTRRGQIGKELVEAWNQEHPYWAYGKSKQPTSAFWDAYNRCQNFEVMRPSWTLPPRG